MSVDLKGKYNQHLNFLVVNSNNNEKRLCLESWRVLSWMEKGMDREREEEIEERCEGILVLNLTK